ncbi:MAG: hypothetical protein KAT90_02940 [Gammaproteobacteria bacterium]|nr:hypothetical protein [Gammaproteobacteria bacterium]
MDCTTHYPQGLPCWGIQGEPALIDKLLEVRGRLIEADLGEGDWDGLLGS